MEEVAEVKDLVSGPKANIGDHQTQAVRAKLAACEGEVVKREAPASGVADGSLKDFPRETGGRQRHVGQSRARRGVR